MNDSVEKVVSEMREAAVPVAFLHDITHDDDEMDQALSFTRDSFPFSELAGYRSLRAYPLYTAPPLGALVEKWQENSDEIERVIGHETGESRIWRAAARILQAAIQGSK